jgi:hypothetical protein
MRKEEKPEIGFKQTTSRGFFEGLNEITNSIRDALVEIAELKNELIELKKLINDLLRKNGL